MQGCTAVGARKRSGRSVIRIILLVFGVVLFLSIMAGLAGILGLGTGCWDHADCERVKQELNEFVGELNEQCEQGLEMSEAEDLGQYDFSGADAIGLSKPNTFRAMKFRRNLGDLISKTEWERREYSLTTLDREWTVESTADKCDSTELCVFFDDTLDCNTGTGDDAEDSLDGGHIPMYLPGVKHDGTFEYWLKEGKEVNVRWK